MHLTGVVGVGDDGGTVAGRGGQLDRGLDRLGLPVGHGQRELRHGARWGVVLGRHGQDVAVHGGGEAGRLGRDGERQVGGQPVRVLGEPGQVQRHRRSPGLGGQGPAAHPRRLVLLRVHLDRQGQHGGEDAVGVDVLGVGDLEGDRRRAGVGRLGGVGQRVGVHHVPGAVGVRGPHRGGAGQLHRLAAERDDVVVQLDLHPLPSEHLDRLEVGSQHRTGVGAAGHADEGVGAEPVLVGDLVGEHLAGVGHGDLDRPVQRPRAGRSLRDRDLQGSAAAVRVVVVGQHLHLHLGAAGDRRGGHHVVHRDRWPGRGVRRDHHGQQPDGGAAVQVGGVVLDQVAAGLLGGLEGHQTGLDARFDPLVRAAEGRAVQGELVAVGVGVVGEHVHAHRAPGLHPDGVRHGQRRAVRIRRRDHPDPDGGGGLGAEPVPHGVAERVRPGRGGVGLVVDVGRPDRHDPAELRRHVHPEQVHGVPVRVDPVRRDRDPDAFTGERAAGDVLRGGRTVGALGTGLHVDDDLGRAGATVLVGDRVHGGVPAGDLRCLVAHHVARHEDQPVAGLLHQLVVEVEAQRGRVEVVRQHRHGHVVTGAHAHGVRHRPRRLGTVRTRRRHDQQLPGRGGRAVGDGVADAHRPGQGPLGGDPQQAVVQDRHVQAEPGRDVHTAHRQQPSGRVHVVGEHIGQHGAARRQQRGVAHRDRVAVLRVAHLHPDHPGGGQTVVVGHHVGQVVVLRLLGGEREGVVLGVEHDAHPVRLAHAGQAQRPTVGVVVVGHRVDLQGLAGEGGGVVEHCDRRLGGVGSQVDLDQRHRLVRAVADPHPHLVQACTQTRVGDGHQAAGVGDHVQVGVVGDPAQVHRVPVGVAEGVEEVDGHRGAAGDDGGHLVVLLRRRVHLRRVHPQAHTGGVGATTAVGHRVLEGGGAVRSRVEPHLQRPATEDRHHLAEGVPDRAERLDREQIAVGVGVVVDHGQHCGAARPHPEAVVLGDRRTVLLVTVEALLLVGELVRVLRGVLDRGDHAVPVVHQDQGVLGHPRLAGGQLVQDDVAPVGPELQLPAGRLGHREGNRLTVIADPQVGGGGRSPGGVHAAGHLHRLGGLTGHVRRQHPGFAPVQRHQHQGVRGREHDRPARGGGALQPGAGGVHVQAGQVHRVGLGPQQGERVVLGVIAQRYRLVPYGGELGLPAQRVDVELAADRDAGFVAVQPEQLAGRGVQPERGAVVSDRLGGVLAEHGLRWCAGLGEHAELVQPEHAPLARARIEHTEGVRAQLHVRTTGQRHHRRLHGHRAGVHPLQPAGETVVDEHHVLALQQVHVLAERRQTGIDLTDRVVQPADEHGLVVGDPHAAVIELHVGGGHTVVGEAEHHHRAQHQGHHGDAGDASSPPAQPGPYAHPAPSPRVLPQILARCCGLLPTRSTSVRRRCRRTLRTCGVATNATRSGHASAGATARSARPGRLRGGSPPSSCAHDPRRAPRVRTRRGRPPAPA